MLTLDGNAFRVVLSDEPLDSEEGLVKWLGVTDETSNMIVIDGTLPADRQAEVLMHELVHAADSYLGEMTVVGLGKRMYGILKENDLLPSDFLERAVDGEASEEEMGRVHEMLKAQEKQMEAAPGMMMMRSAARAATAGGQAAPKTGGEPGTGAEPPASGASADDAGGSGGSASDGGPEDLTGLKRTVTALRGEVRLLRTENRDLKQFKKVELDKGRTAEEKLRVENAELQKRAEAAETARTEALRQQAFVTRALQEGAISPVTAYRLVDKATLVVADDGTVSGVEEAVAALKTSESYLFAPAQSGGGGRPATINAGAAGESPPRVKASPEQVDMAAKLGVTLNK